jgi:hypothetical protein
MTGDVCRGGVIFRPKSRREKKKDKETCTALVLSLKKVGKREYVKDKRWTHWSYTCIGWFAFCTIASLTNTYVLGLGQRLVSATVAHALTWHNGKKFRCTCDRSSYSKYGF